MPIYSFLNVKTGDVEDKIMKYSEREQFLKDNVDVICVPGTMNHLDPIRMGTQKPDEGFRDVLRTIKSKHHGSKINTF